MNAISIPSIITRCARKKMDLNESSFAATKPIIVGGNGCPAARKNFVNMVINPLDSTRISRHAGITPVSRNEFAAPPMIAKAYATYMFGEDTIPAKYTA